MNKTIKTILTAAVAATIVLTVVAAVMSAMAMMNEFDHVLGYFNAGSVTAALGMYLPMAVPVIGIGCWIFMGKKVSFHRAPDVNVPTIFASVLTGLLMAVTGVMAFIGGNLTNLELGAAILGIISGVYFLLMPFLNDKGFMSVLSFAPPVWAAFELLEEYFREGMPINSPIRTSNLTMFALLLLFFAEEIRFYIDRQVAGAWYFCNLSALAFTGAAVFPKLAVFFVGTEGFDFSFIDLCLGAAVFLFLLARLTAAPAALGEYIPRIKPKKASADEDQDVPTVNRIVSDIPGTPESDEGASDE